MKLSSSCVFLFSLTTAAGAFVRAPPIPIREVGKVAGRDLVSECAFRVRARAVQDAAAVAARGDDAAVRRPRRRRDAAAEQAVPSFAALAPRLEPLCPELVEAVRRDALPEPDIGDILGKIGSGITDFFNGVGDGMDQLLDLLDGVEINGVDIAPCVSVLGPPVVACGTALFQLGKSVQDDASCVLEIIDAVPDVPEACGPLADALKTCIQTKQCDVS